MLARCVTACMRKCNSKLEPWSLVEPVACTLEAGGWDEQVTVGWVSVASRAQHLKLCQLQVTALAVQHFCDQF
jgi:hypothetical protein